MRSRIQVMAKLKRLFRRKRAALLDELRQALGTTSRTTIFRILKAVGYFTSYSHAGRYYTLRRIPKFDRWGLWIWRGIGFSSRGTLRATAAFLIEESPAGQTHEELRQRLGLRIYDTLCDLTVDGAVRRERFEDAYLYLSADPKKAALQLAERHRQQAAMAARPADPLLVIDVLVQVLHHPHGDAALVAARLRKAGRAVTRQQVEQIFHTYRVKKTAARSRSRRLQASDRPYGSCRRTAGSDP